MLFVSVTLVDRLTPLGLDPSSMDIDRHEDPWWCSSECCMRPFAPRTSSAFVGRLGTDSFGDSIFGLMSRLGRDLSGLQRDSRRPTRVVLVHRNSDADRVFSGFSGDDSIGYSDQFFDISQLISVWPSLSRHAQWFSVGTIPLASSGSSECLTWLLKECISAGISVAVDLNWRPTFGINLFSTLMGQMIRP